MKTFLPVRRLLPTLGLLMGPAILIAAPVHADNGAEQETRERTTPPVAAEAQLREALQVVLLDMVQSGAFGDTPPDALELSIESPRQRVGDLGILVDSADVSRTRDGLRVLGTTPGSNAERIGLRTGDLITAINGHSLTPDDGSSGNVSAAARLRDTVAALDDGARVTFDIRRDSRPLTVAGVLVGTWLPAMRLSIGAHALASAASTPSTSGCGRIVIFDVAPRQEGLHAASLNRIDDSTAGVTGQTTFRVPVGRHVLEVGERIEPRYLSFNDRQRNSAGVRYKTLVVDVAPDTEYLVAARLNEDKRSEWKDAAYWDPVVWREAASACR